MMEWIRRLFPAAAILWALALPLAASRSTESPGSTALSRVFRGAVYAAGAVVCHQRPERSFAWGAHRWPVCARCTGIYEGSAIAALLMVGFTRRSTKPDAPVVGAATQRREPTVDGRRARALIAAALVPTMITLGAEWATGHVPSNLVRALAGLPIGAAVSWLVLRSRAPQAAVGVN
jgi:hypothetical protein